MRVTLTADAINSQALCSCLAAANDHVAAGRTGTDDQGGFASSNSSRSNCATEALHEPALPAHEAWLAGLQRNRPRVHWAVLTTVVTAAAWLVANAVPFFSDLVGLIGGLTQAPLSLLLPTVLYRRIARPLGPVHGVTTLLIVAAASLLVLYGTSSALSKIALDWTSSGQPFACGQNMPDEGASISRLPTRKGVNEVQSFFHLVPDPPGLLSPPRVISTASLCGIASTRTCWPTSRNRTLPR